LFRQDRSCGVKGGWVLLCVKSYLRAVEVKLTNGFPEQVWCRIQNKECKEVLIGVCYRTPTEQVYGSSIHATLRELLNEVGNKNFVLMGDFNYRNIDWERNVCDSSAPVECKLFLDCIQDSFLTQHVRCLTTDRSVLDLVVTKEPEIVENVISVGKFSSSDHNLLMWTINIGCRVESSTRKRYNYRNMDLVGIKDQLRLIDWDKEMEG
jgi:hypothetical protein